MSGDVLGKPPFLCIENECRGERGGINQKLNRLGEIENRIAIADANQKPMDLISQGLSEAALP